MVVISIIGILAGLTLTGFNAARKNARDTTRKSDLAQYRAALEAYASNTQGKYPDADGQSSNSSGIFAVNNALIIPRYLPTKIPDPSDGSSFCDGTQLCTYYYRRSGDLLEYVLYARLETGGVWEVCSNGKVGKPTSYSINATCDL